MDAAHSRMHIITKERHTIVMLIMNAENAIRQRLHPNVLRQVLGSAFINWQNCVINLLLL